MKICLAGEGAQSITHADALRKFEGIEIDTLAGGIAADAEAFAHERGIGHWSLDLEECLARDGVEDRHVVDADDTEGLFHPALLEERRDEIPGGCGVRHCATGRRRYRWFRR